MPHNAPKAGTIPFDTAQKYVQATGTLSGSQYTYKGAMTDRASLTVLAGGIRGDYVAPLRLLVPDASKIFLLTMEDADESESADHELAAADEVSSLYSSDFNVALEYVESAGEIAPELPGQVPLRTTHKIYRLSSRSGSR